MNMNQNVADVCVLTCKDLQDKLALGKKSIKIQNSMLSIICVPYVLGNTYTQTWR